MNRVTIVDFFTHILVIILLTLFIIADNPEWRNNCGNPVLKYLGN